MKDIVLAARYAKALLDSIEQDETIDGVHEEFSLFITAVTSDVLFLKCLTHPLIKLPEKKKLINDVASQLKFSKKFTNFLLLLLDKERINIIETIQRQFNSLYKKRKGEQEIDVVSAVALPEAAKTALKQTFSNLLHKNVHCNFSIEEDCVGGIKVKVGSQVYDGTLQNKLECLKNS